MRSSHLEVHESGLGSPIERAQENQPGFRNLVSLSASPNDGVPVERSANLG